MGPGHRGNGGQYQGACGVVSCACSRGTSVGVNLHGHVAHVEVVEDGGLVHVAELGEVVHALENGRVAQPYVGVWMSLLDLNRVLAFNNICGHKCRVACVP